MKKENKYIYRQKMWFIIAVISMAINITIDVFGVFLAIMTIFSVLSAIYNWFNGLVYESKRKQKNFEDLLNNMKNNNEKWKKQAESAFNNSYEANKRQKKVEDLLNNMKQNNKRWKKQAESYNSYKQQKTVPLSHNKLVDAFGLFKLKLDASPGEFKKEYRKLVLKWHPDKWTTDTQENQEIAERNFKKLNNAYNLIKQYKNIK